MASCYLLVRARARCFTGGCTPQGRPTGREGDCEAHEKAVSPVTSGACRDMSLADRGQCRCTWQGSQRGNSKSSVNGPAIVVAIAGQFQARLPYRRLIRVLSRPVAGTDTCVIGRSVLRSRPVLEQGVAGSNMSARRESLRTDTFGTSSPLFSAVTRNFSWASRPGSRG